MVTDQPDSFSIRAFQLHHFTTRALNVDVRYLIAVAFESHNGFGVRVRVASRIWRLCSGLTRYERRKTRRPSCIVTR
jgi:hypothetical protein